MRRLAILAAVALVAGCGDAKRYRHFGDQLKASTGGLFGYPCITAHTLMSMRECYRFDPPQRMSGIWLDDFEGSEFVPTGGRAPGNDWSGERFLLNFDGVPTPFRRAGAGEMGKAYAVTLIGRRRVETRSNSSLHFMIVDKWLAGHEVPRPEQGDLVR